jgi:hypothetical protein
MNAQQKVRLVIDWTRLILSVALLGLIGLALAKALSLPSVWPITISDWTALAAFIASVGFAMSRL